MPAPVFALVAEVAGTDIAGSPERPGSLASQRLAWTVPAVALSAAVSQPPIRGTRGEPVARAVVRWSDLVRQKAETAPPRAEAESEDPQPIPQELPVPSLN